MLYNVIVIIFSLIISIIILRKEFNKKYEKIIEWLKVNKLVIITFVIFVVGFTVRLIGITNYPNGLNCDEASIGYEAYSLLNYGIDRNGNSWPVFLEAWGSGQNALYMYIIMPFIKILGLTKLAVRLPMAIIGCISLIGMYKILQKTKNPKIAVLGLAFFAICPWHIMKSRYGLESNIFPDLALWGAYFYVTALENNKILKLYIGSILFGLCAYAYGTSYYFLPSFLTILFVILIIKKKINIKQAIICLAIVFVISLPIILMLIINTFDLEQITIWKITIPRLESNRYETLTVLSSDNIINTLITNFKKSIKMLIFQNDGYNANTLKSYGIIYIFSLPITIIGLINCIIKRKENINLIFNIWFISAFFLTFICEPNINRMNILYIPLIYYTSIGIYEITQTINWSIYILLLIYIFEFISFQINYYQTDFTQTYTFYDNIENVIKYSDSIQADKIYFQYAFKEPYIYILFYNQGNTKEFVETVKYKNDTKGFDSVISFEKYIFSLPNKINEEENAAYIMLKDKEKDYDIDETKYDKIYIDNFVVINKK